MCGNVLANKIDKCHKITEHKTFNFSENSLSRHSFAVAL